ncbi:PX-domain-containing protein [Ascodesmis nigricans]|uniref:PX-domain-containing protein n=1 Tax=Ascodesmis nigricans TaxID=341454 RepID=A0A4S2N6U4_9PEZI|nr:PX-domain-containing protein [Ascodesmis nigricans]
MWEDNNPLAYTDESPPSSSHFPHYSDSPSPPASPPTFAPFTANSSTQRDNAYAPSESSVDESGADGRGGNGATRRQLTQEEEEEEEYRRMKRQQGYSSRIEQMFLERDKVDISILDAGKNHEGSGGGFIVYTIKTGDLEVRRRYSEFESLRKNLSLLHPCLIVPPIPEKHHVSDYVTSPTGAKENVNIIDHRKRMLSVFLNRCARIREIRYDSVFHRFLDPNASWSEVITSPPISNLPKNHLRAPPLTPSEPTNDHQYLPIPPSSAKLKTSPKTTTSDGPPGGYGRFPPLNHNLTESELDPYFNNYEAATRTYESLLTGSIERVNRRILKRLQELSLDYNELGARYNGFSLSESGDLSTAIERIGQAVDSTYIATEELARTLGSSFAEPIRESAQFAGVVQKVLRYRVLKRCQEEMTRDLLSQKRLLLESLEKSEMEARRIEQYLHGTTSGSNQNPIGRDSNVERPAAHSDDVQSIDSADFPPTHSEEPSFTSASPPKRSKSTRQPDHPTTTHRKAASYSTGSGGNIFSRGIGKLNYALHGVVDVDPERTRRDNIGKTKELLVQLEGAEKAAEKDVEEIGRAVLKDLRRFQAEKQGDLKAVMRTYAKVQIEWAKRCLEAWEEAEKAVGEITVR